MIIKVLDVEKTSYYEGGTVELNRSSKYYNTCRAEFLTQASTYLPQVGQDIKVYDNDSNLYFGGKIKTATHSEFAGGNSNEASVRTSLFSDGYNSIPEGRTITASFSTSYAGDMIKYLLNNVLNDDTYNENLSTTGNIDNGAFYTQYNKGISSVKEILDQLADASGFTWYIDSNKALNFEAETTTPAAAHDLMSTGTFKDFHAVQAGNSLLNYKNKQYVIGDVGEDGTLVSGLAQDTAQFTARQAIEGGSTWASGVYGNVIHDTNIKSDADALTLATNELKQNSRTGKLAFKSYSLDWEPFTKLKVKLPKYGIDTDTYYLITNVSIKSQTQNREIAVIDAVEKDDSDFGSQSKLDNLKFMTELVRVAKDGGTGGLIYDSTSSTYYKTQIYVQDDVPTNVPAKTIHLDTDDWSRMDLTALTTNATISESDNEFITCNGNLAVTLHSGANAGVMKFIHNVGTGTVSLVGTINGSTTSYLYPTDSALLITDGTNWRT